MKYLKIFTPFNISNDPFHTILENNLKTNIYLYKIKPIFHKLPLDIIKHILLYDEHFIMIKRILSHFKSLMV
jgi:hypothetical protein